MKENIYNLEIKDLEDFLISNGAKKFNALQIFEWLYKKRVKSFEEMTNLSQNLRVLLQNNFEISSLKMIKKQSDKKTCKYLFELFDDNLIEAVVMMHDYGNSICISSQVGCNMGCTFCESGRLKKIRDLQPFEMIMPIVMLEEDLNIRLSSVVIMGIGEPFDNYDNVIKFVKIINHPKALEIGARHITISTSGIIPGIEKFMDLDLQVNLAISLHAPNDEIRSKIMPINNAYNINSLISSLRKYIVKTGRRVTIEYVMIDNVNDSDNLAVELASLIRGMNVYVNLIPYNETSNDKLKKSTKTRILGFYDTLKKEGINVTIRREFGSNIDAACGQLRSKEVNM